MTMSNAVTHPETRAEDSVREVFVAKETAVEALQEHASPERDVAVVRSVGGEVVLIVDATSPSRSLGGKKKLTPKFDPTVTVAAWTETNAS
jgi:hypothetical protein